MIGGAGGDEFAVDEQLDRGLRGGAWATDGRVGWGLGSGWARRRAGARAGARKPRKSCVGTLTAALASIVSGRDAIPRIMVAMPGPSARAARSSVCRIMAEGTLFIPCQLQTPGKIYSRKCALCRLLLGIL